MRSQQMLRSTISCAVVSAMTFISVHSASSEMLKVSVKIENLAPENGNFLTPVWVAFHNGDFDILDLNSPATPGLERLAEDGNTSVIAQEFLSSGFGILEATLPGPTGPIAPGDIFENEFIVDSEDDAFRYFSYASMVIPSNDAFISNRFSKRHPLFRNGRFALRDFFIVGGNVFDAGTEVNDEIPANTAFFGQAAPNVGDDENGVVLPHDGFNHPSTGGILGSADFEAADFIQAGYPVAKFSFSATPVILFSAELSGDQEVPPNTTTASGTAHFELVDDGSVLTYEIITSGLNNVTAAHLHLAPAGSNGGVVAFLLAPRDAGSGLFDEVISGSITADDLINALDGRPLEALLEAIEEGNIYINIHTDDGIDPPNSGNPGDIASGELRGQLASNL